MWTTTALTAPADAVREIASEDPRIRLLQRPGKLGLGTAVADGFALAEGDYWIMMDADLSHRPEELPKMLSALSDADIVDRLTLRTRRRSGELAAVEAGREPRGLRHGAA